IIQALKESKKTSRRLLGTRGSNERTSTIPEIPNESTVVSATSNEQDSEHSNDDEKDKKDGDADDEDVETESDEDDINKYKIPVRKDEDEKMKEAEVEGSDKGDEEIIDAAKEEAEKTSEAKDDTKKSELPSSSSSLYSPSVQKIPVLVIPKITNLAPIPEIVTETSVSTAVPSPQVTPIISSIQQTPTPIPTPLITTNAPTVTIAVLESNALYVVELRVTKLEKDVSELKNVDHSFEAHDVLQSQVPTVVDSYLDAKVEDVFQKEPQKHTTYLIHKYSLQHLPELTNKSTAEQESEKSPLDILKIKKEQVESQKNPQFTIKSIDKAALE
ncbi:hypothetical protein Tco_0916733, partial [Tanacetum coccineum]